MRRSGCEVHEPIIRKMFEAGPDAEPVTQRELDRAFTHSVKCSVCKELWTRLQQAETAAIESQED